MLRKALCISAACAQISTGLYAQGGCSDLLVGGVFDTFNESAGSLSQNEWHQAWCNGTLEAISSGGHTSVTLKAVVKAIPIGLSLEDANTFQKLYKQVNCGEINGGSIDWSQHQITRRVASPALVAAYVQCREIETKGLQVEWNVRPEDNKTFSISVKFIQTVPGVTTARITSVTFQPNVVACQGDLVPDAPLNVEAKTLACERQADVPLTMVIGTNLGIVRRDLRGFYPPPTDGERVMAVLPRGTILPWYAAAIPVGWSLCDGTQGTPNLVDRYPIGTSDPQQIGGALGSASHTHTVSGRTGPGGGLGRSGSGDRYLSENGHSHEFSATTAEASNLPPSTRVRFIMKL